MRGQCFSLNEDDDFFFIKLWNSPIHKQAELCSCLALRYLQTSNSELTYFVFKHMSFACIRVIGLASYHMLAAFTHDICIYVSQILMWRRSVSEKSISWISTPQILPIFIVPRLSGLIQKKSWNQMSYICTVDTFCAFKLAA